MSDLSKAPSVKEGDWIRLGHRPSGVDRLEGIVLRVFELGKIEVAYLQNGHKPIKSDVVWKSDHWAFLCDGPSGGYLPKSWVERLQKGAPIRPS